MEAAILGVDNNDTEPFARQNSILNRSKNRINVNRSLHRNQQFSVNNLGGSNPKSVRPKQNRTRNYHHPFLFELHLTRYPFRRGKRACC